jgi:hypothetical protein
MVFLFRVLVWAEAIGNLFMWGCHLRFRKVRKKSAILIAAVLVTGCHSISDSHPLPKENFADTPEAQMDFWHSMASKKLATHREAFHGLILYLDNKDASNDFAGSLELLKSRKIIPVNFTGGENEAITQGTLAVAICHVLKIKGGVMLHMLADEPRYAHRELQYLNVFPAGSANQVVSGAELVGIIGKLEDYSKQMAGGGK